MIYWEDVPDMLIIGDVGSNWNCLEDCVDSIKALAKAGAHYAKFQYFNYEKLYGVKPTTEMYHAMPKHWIPILAETCEEFNIKFMCSVFHPDDVAFIDEFVDTHKVASAEVGYISLLKEISYTDKTCLVSTGCASGQDLMNAKRILKKNFAPMACTMEYPASAQPLKNMMYLNMHYKDHYLGYSDHSLDLSAGPYIAKANGCTFYERHFCLDRIYGTPDKAHSLNEELFEKVVNSFFWITHPDAIDWHEHKSEHKRLNGPFGYHRREPFC